MSCDAALLTSSLIVNPSPINDMNPDRLHPFPRLETERLILRNVKIEDSTPFHIQRTDSRVLKYMDREPFKEEAETVRWVREKMDDWKQKKAISWVLTDKKTGQFMGDIAFWRFWAQDHRAEIGYGMMPEHWGQGYMREAGQAALKWGFEVLGLRTVMADINPDNDASRQLLLRWGFKKEGYLRENCFFRGGYVDSEIYGLVSGEHLD